MFKRQKRRSKREKDGSEEKIKVSKEKIKAEKPEDTMYEFEYDEELEDE